MHTENTVYIQGDLARIFELAANIEDWPIILPHYRWVTVFDKSKDGLRKTVEMAALRNNFPLPGATFPVRWRSVQIIEPQAKRILFKHIAGIAIGMWVVWTLEPDPWGRGVKVTIAHDLRYPFMVLNGWFAQELVGKDFVQAIAGRTLNTLKTIVELEQSMMNATLETDVTS